MKKFFFLILSFALVVSGLVNIDEFNVAAHALNNEKIIENVDWSDLGLSDVKITFRETNSKNVRTTISEPTVEIEFYNNTTNETVKFERIGSYGYYYANEELVTIIEYDISPNTRAGVTIPSGFNIRYDVPKPGNSSQSYQWSNFALSSYETWVIREIKSIAQGALLSVFLAAVTGGISTSIDLATSVISDVASSLYRGYQLSQNVDDFYAVNFEYVSRYVECNILHWYGLQSVQYTNANYTTIDEDCVQSDFEMNSDHYWYANPNDYTQPTACRLITSTYPW